MFSEKATRCLAVKVVILAMVFTVPALAGSRKEMVTGCGYWKFNAQEARKGKPAKGCLYQENLDTGVWREVDIDLVSVGETTAHFSGKVVRASDAAKVGSTWWVLVKDGGSSKGEVGMDYFRGGRSATMPGWVSTPNFANNTPFYEGNVQIH